MNMERSLFFGSIGADRRYVSQDFATWITFFFTDGIAPAPATTLQVGAGSGLTVTVQPGGCKVGGRIGMNAAAATLAVSLPDGSYDRIDRVVARCNHTERHVQLLVLEGVPDATPAAPALVRTSDLYDIGLATVWVAKGAESIGAEAITDTRTSQGVCGLCTAVIPLDTEAVFAQYEAIFMAFMSGVRETLSEDTAGNLLNLIQYHAPVQMSAALPASGWNANAPYTQTLTVPGMLASDTPLVDVALSDTDETAITQLYAYGCIGRIDAGNGQITVKCYEEHPSVDLTLAMKVVR